MVRKYFDIVLYNNLDKKAKFAEELGYYGLLVVLKEDEITDFKLPRIDFPLYFGLLIETNNFKKIYSILRKVGGYFDYIFVKTSDLSVLRRACSLKISGIVDPEKNSEKDNMLYFKGGIDQGIITKLINNNIYVVWSLDIDERILRRKLQNSKIIKKYGIKLLIGSFAKDLGELVPPRVKLAFSRMLGFSYETVSDNFVDFLRYNRRLRNPDFITRDSYIVWRRGMDCYEY